MDFKTEALATGTIVGVMLVVRLTGRFLPRRRVALAVVVTVLAAVISTVVFRLRDEPFVLWIGLALGLIAGAIERWLAVWRGDEVKWIP